MSLGLPVLAQPGSGLPRTVSPDGRACDNNPHSEPAVGMLDGVFTQSIGIVPIFAWRASARWY